MIWLANYNAGPISYNYGSDGKPVAIASNVSLAGKSWNVYYGSNGSNYVYSFLPTSGTYTSFSGDVNAFLKVGFFFVTFFMSQKLMISLNSTSPRAAKYQAASTLPLFSLVPRPHPALPH
jgi:xyloglucan-specific endo-beta-1,4-glucanase